jgi:hypothetical protein
MTQHDIRAALYAPLRVLLILVVRCLQHFHRQHQLLFASQQKIASRNLTHEP